MDAANFIENEQVHILDKNNGNRFITYVIKAKRGSGVICLNGPAAKLVNVGDVVIIISTPVWILKKPKRSNLGLFFLIPKQIH